MTNGTSTEARLGRFDFLSVSTIAMVTIATAALYTRLPERVPIHFGLHGRPDGWAHRAVGACLLPLLALAIWAFVRFARALLPRPWRARLQGEPVAAAAFATTALFCALQLLVLQAAISGGASIGRGLSLALGAFWLALAQIYPRLRRNPIIGIRTAWTLTSDENWARTHRVASYAFTVAGMLALAAGSVRFAGALPLTLAALLMSSAVPVVYSFLLARRLLGR